MLCWWQSAQHCHSRMPSSKAFSSQVCRTVTADTRCSLLQDDPGDADACMDATAALRWWLLCTPAAVSGPAADIAATTRHYSRAAFPDFAPDPRGSTCAGFVATGGLAVGQSARHSLRRPASVTPHTHHGRRGIAVWMWRRVIDRGMGGPRCAAQVAVTVEVRSGALGGELTHQAG